MLLSRFKEFITEHNLIIPEKNIILGLSGGPDSVFLLYILLQSGLLDKKFIIAAHIDHGWRAQSFKDLEFCQNLCQQLGVQFESISLKECKSTEEEGRNGRRAFFESLALKYNASCIALAHHANDQQETFFLRLIRGASLEGLIGIRPKSGLYIHPLLTIYKQEILDYPKKATRAHKENFRCFKSGYISGKRLEMEIRSI